MYVTVGVRENDEKSRKYGIVGPFPFSQFQNDWNVAWRHEEKNAAQDDVSVLAATTQRYGPNFPSPITNDVLVGRQSNRAKQ